MKTQQLQTVHRLLQKFSAVLTEVGLKNHDSVIDSALQTEPLSQDWELLLGLLFTELPNLRSLGLAISKLPGELSCDFFAKHANFAPKFIVEFSEHHSEN